VLAGVALVVARHGEFIGEVTAGCLLLFSAAYFPVDILPNWIQTITMVNPLTYWLEGMRRTVSGGILVGADGQPLSPMLAAFDNGQLFAILGITAAITAFLAIIFYNWVEHQAKERGMIDRVSSY
jgi:ABC-type polysaccharide/polyol phosphate export permease